MKKLLLALTLIASLSALASESKCFKKVSKDYRQLTIERNYDYDYVIDEVMSIEEMADRWEYTFETELAGDNYIVYQAASEYMSGFGYDALIVDRDTCETVEVDEVYAE
jgi:hypothetical protein